MPVRPATARPTTTVTASKTQVEALLRGIFGLREAFIHNLRVAAGWGSGR